ncbi:MAG TPA: CZB domain-containing protein, partial [Geobacterales bacterium]|nr:CZB domain-containing protein [Geobacterales bacterium]
LEQINAVTQQVNQIATAAEEQTATTSEISSNMQQITEVVEGTARGAHDSAKAANMLAKLAEELQTDISRFKLRGVEVSMLDVAANDHRLFVQRIHSAINGDLQLSPDQVATHHTCRFGSWYEGEGARLCGTMPSFRAIDEPHERIHSLAREAVAAAIKGDKQKAQQLYNQIEALSHQVVELLQAIKKEFIQRRAA